MSQSHSESAGRLALEPATQPGEIAKIGNSGPGCRLSPIGSLNRASGRDPPPRV